MFLKNKLYPMQKKKKKMFKIFAVLIFFSLFNFKRFENNILTKTDYFYLTEACRYVIIF